MNHAFTVGVEEEFKILDSTTRSHRLEPALEFLVA